MDTMHIAYAKQLRHRNPAAWRAEYATALDGCCEACHAGQRILYGYVSYFGAACHVHTRPVWVRADAAPVGQDATCG